MHIDFMIRNKIKDLIERMMLDYAHEIEQAYSRKEGEFQIAFKVKIAPVGAGTKVKVEIAFDPHEKIKDRIEEVIDRSQRKLFNDSAPAFDEKEPDDDTQPQDPTTEAG